MINMVNQYVEEAYEEIYFKFTCDFIDSEFVEFVH